MAKWRQEAIARLPDLRQMIASQPNVMSLWIELRFALERAYAAEPWNEATIAGIFAFAAWSMGAPRCADAAHDPSTAVFVAFFEDLPTIQRARDDMPRWIPFAGVANNRQTFAYHIGDAAYDELVAFMSRNRHRYRPREA